MTRQSEWTHVSLGSISGIQSSGARALETKHLDATPIPCFSARWTLANYLIPLLWASISYHKRELNRNAKLYTTLENSLAVPWKDTCRVTTWAVTLLVIYRREVKTSIHTKTCTWVFKRAQRWEQHKCSSAAEWINRRWYVHTMECYLAIKKIMKLASMDEPWKHC